MIVTDSTKSTLAGFRHQIDPDAPADSSAMMQKAQEKGPY